MAVIYSLDSAPTAVSAEMASQSINILKKNGVEIVELGIMKALKPFLLFTYFFNKLDGILYFGHGLEDTLVGQLPLGIFLPVLKVGDKVKTNVIYVVACLSAKKLGPFLSPRYTRAYLGNKDYTFVAFPGEKHNYTRDFIDVFVEPVRVLAQGDTVGDAFISMREKMRRYIELYESNRDKWPEADYYAWAMRENLEGYQLIGDPYAKIIT